MPDFAGLEHPLPSPPLTTPDDFALSKATSRQDRGGGDYASHPLMSSPIIRAASPALRHAPLPLALAHSRSEMYCGPDAGVGGASTEIRHLPVDVLVGRIWMSRQ